uniref:Uncharacterized protein n=1 Tax=Nelumbo nucifera TaxID=4432 RepID=A0A822YKD7_NELNU|nr:TPA_asm: hypothetical protein HUJ06_010620 [Nelumbo nucifera]
MGTLLNIHSKSYSTVAQENVVATLLNISISNRDVLMSTSTPATVQNATTTLYSLLVRDIIFALVDIIQNSNSPARSMKDALKALFGISLYPLNRATMVELGAVPALFLLVVKDDQIGVIEDATTIQLRGPDAMMNFATSPKAK